MVLNSACIIFCREAKDRSVVLPRDLGKISHLRIPRAGSKVCPCHVAGLRWLSNLENCTLVTRLAENRFWPLGRVGGFELIRTRDTRDV